MDKVSIIVVTYNSSLFIEETLDSIAQQKYNYIELIISDDCSTDNTISICERWLERNKDKFLDSKIVQNTRNMGITYNYNLGADSATGKYLKFIEGDDLLYEDCIVNNLEYIKKNNSNIIFSKALLFGQVKEEVILPRINSCSMKKYTSSSKNLLNVLLRENIFINPTIFLEKRVWSELNGFDNKYKMLVDYPFFLKVVLNNYKVSYLNEITVKYRKHENNLSLSDSVSDRYISPKFYSDIRAFYFDVRYHLLLENRQLLSLIETRLNIFIYDLVIKLGNKKRIHNILAIVKILCFWKFFRRLKERF